MNNSWKVLSGVNVNDDKERKGRFDYLSWAHAWKHVQNNVESATYELLDDVVYPDNSREVRCSVTIDGVTHMMWLPVMDNNNRAIKNPDARAINDARQRCLVKAVAMHGLGLYIYAGEGIPDAPGEAPAPQKPAPKKPAISVHPLPPKIDTFDLYKHNGDVIDSFTEGADFAAAYFQALEKYQGSTKCTPDHIDALKEKNQASIDMLGAHSQTEILDKTKWARTQVMINK